MGTNKDSEKEPREFWLYHDAIEKCTLQISTEKPVENKWVSIFECVIPYEDYEKLQRENESLKAQLALAVKFLREGKRLFTPDTTNSDVDEFLKRHKETKASGEEQSEEDDPTPYCSGCGSMTMKGCECGPIADND